MKILLVAFLLAAAACTQVTTPLSPTGIEPGAYANDLVIADEADHGGKLYEAILAGPPGSGVLEMTANVGQAELCYVLRTGIQDISAVHLHRAAGNVEVFTLELPVNGTAHSCVDNLDVALIRGIRQAPADYYVAIHTPIGVSLGILQSRKGPFHW